jgi:hypothetical protein
MGTPENDKTYVHHRQTANSEIMAPTSNLNFFVHRIGGVEYGGWFRIVAPDCIEVMAPGFMSVLPLDGKTVEEVSCRALEEFVRGRLRTGAPVPPAAPNERSEADHVCDAKSASRE